jgi:hypothetical protein
MDEDYPRTLLELERRFASDEVCRESYSVAMAGGVHLSPLWGSIELADETRLGTLRLLPLSGLGHWRHHFSGQPHPAYHVVPLDVENHQPRVRRQRAGVATGAGTR